MQMAVRRVTLINKEITDGHALSWALAAALQQRSDLFDVLRSMTEWWAYAMAKPLGTAPNADDHKEVERLAAAAITALHNVDPSYVHRLPRIPH